MALCRGILQISWPPPFTSLTLSPPALLLKAQGVACPLRPSWMRRLPLTWMMKQRMSPSLQLGPRYLLMAPPVQFQIERHRRLGRSWRPPPTPTPSMPWPVAPHQQANSPQSTPESSHTPPPKKSAAPKTSPQWQHGPPAIPPYAPPQAK